MEPLIFVGFLALMIVMAILGARADAKRKKQLAEWATAKGLTFEQGYLRGLDAQHPTFSALRRGDDRYALNVMRGAWAGREAMFFDYHYETTSTDSKGRRQTHHHYFSAVIIKGGFPMKHLAIRPEGFFDKIGEFFGMDDIDFESAEFSRRFHVSAKDKRWAYDILHPRAMEFLMKSPTVTLCMDTSSVIAALGSRTDPAGFESAAGVVTGLLDLVPEYVRIAASPPPLPEIAP